MQERKTIYVGDILNTVDEEFLRDNFGPEAGFGEIYSLTIGTSRKKTDTNKYAFITYGSQEEAEKVVDAMNYTKLDGHPIRVSLAHPNFQQIRSSGRGNVILRNLDPEIDQRQLYDAFSQYGEIISCKIPTGKNGEQYGVAYVQFKNPEEAQQAIEELQGITINNREITIGEFNATDISTNIHIKTGIPTTVQTTQELKAFLCELLPNKNETEGEENSNHFPNLERAALLKLPNNPDYRQAYLTFSDLDSTAKAEELIEEHGLSCERVTEPDKINHMKQNSAQWEQYKTQESSKRVLFVKNIPLQTTSDELQEFFSQFADVSKCVVNNKNDFSNAFVTFRTEDGAKYALKKSVLACSHLPRRQRRGQKFPLQLHVAAYVDKNSRIRADFAAEDRAGRMAKIADLKRRVESSFAPGTMQRERLGQLSSDQAAALASDSDLFDDWIDSDNNQPYADEESSDEDEDEDEEGDETQPARTWRGRGRGNFRPQRARGGRGGKQWTYRPPQRGKRGKRGGFNESHASNNNQIDDDDDFDTDSDGFD